MLGLIEDWVPETVAHSPWLDRVILMKDIGIPDFRAFIFKLSASQAHQAVKSSFIAYLLSYETHADTVIYLDHTMKLYGPLREAVEALERHSIVLTPRLCEPNYTSSYDRELQFLHAGTFNGGFIGARRNEGAHQFLFWWADKLNRDQWLDLVPVLFDSVVVRHPGYHAACWNLFEQSRQFGSVETDRAVLAGGPLLCVNFRDEKNEFEASLSSLTEQQAEFARKLQQQYNTAIQGHESNGFNRETVWSYDFYYNGERIVQAAREAYSERDNMPFLADPYACSNKHILGVVHEHKKEMNN
ncbi:hypothetical protein [Paenibacillus cellulosilyticus]|uniref:hypothetical protein n=1 Tax=Paenibacillus cellulosilyticus TaxID=375489 RepID=UPI00158107E4|nr:hypothetical protein [Paenibacillus cellulosilyticus]